MSLSGELSHSELKAKLALNLKENSIGQKLKAQLRYFLIQKIQSNTPFGQPKSLVLKAIDSLIVDYLRNNEDDFTLSVFFPECGLDHYSNVRISFKFIGDGRSRYTFNASFILLPPCIGHFYR
jgi:hypothetical protein